MHRIVVIFILCFFLVSPAVAAQEEFVIGIPCINSKNCKIPVLENILKEAYSRSGIVVTFKYLPMLRELAEANSGATDGSAARTPIAITDYPNLIQVPVPMVNHSHCAVTTKPGFKVESWEDLQQYVVGVQRGSLSIKIEAEQTGSQVYLFNSLSGAFNMIGAGRLDLIVMDATMASIMAQALGLETIYISEPLSTTHSYHTLNRKHEDLVPKLAKAFREMLEDGTTKRLLGKYEAMLPELPEPSK